MLEASDNDIGIHAVEVCGGGEIVATFSRGQMCCDALLLSGITSNAELILEACRRGLAYTEEVML